MRRIYLFLKGILIGVALVLPGLSGSLMAVLLGIYDDVVSWVASFGKNVRNLLVLGVGALVGILLSAKVVLLLCIAYPGPCNWFFLGLVAGGIPLLIRNVKGRNFTGYGFVPLVFGFGIIFAMAVFAGTPGDFRVAILSVRTVFDVGILLGSGFVSCGLMMFPGVSGSVLLILLGQYGTVYGAVSEFADFSQWPRILPVCVWFAIGGLLGIWLFSALMKWALGKFPRFVHWLILGLTLGTCGSLLWVCVDSYGEPTFSWACFLFFLLGFGAARLTERMECKNKA